MGLHLSLEALIQALRFYPHDLTTPKTTFWFYFSEGERPSACKFFGFTNTPRHLVRECKQTAVGIVTAVFTSKEYKSSFSNGKQKGATVHQTDFKKHS